jgi:hypothetical protein
MKIKWKHIVARFVPAATVVAAFVTMARANGAGVKWG